jgi:hypothetical protein
MTEAEQPVTDWSWDEPWARVAEIHAAVMFLAGDRAVSGTDQIIADQMAAVAEPWPDATVIDTEAGDTAGVPGASLEQALEAIRPHGPQPVWRPSRPYVLPG